MKPTPIHLIVSRIKRLSLSQQIHHLRALIALEKPYSVRRNELESLLSGKITKQLKKENLIHISTERSSKVSSQASAELASA